jgi:probable F420-dependent oxidoreductase
MKVDAGLSGRIDAAATEAAEAEAAGFDGIWAPELNHDPFLPLVAAAEASRAMQLGTSIVVAFARSPMITAQMSWDLQDFSGGRMMLGLGSQIRPHIEKRFSMPWSHPAPRMREYVLALRAIWDRWQNGVKLDFRGDFYQHTLMTPMFDPGPLPSGPPKVFLAAVGTGMTKVAGEVADGILLHAFTTDRYIREVSLPAIDEGLAQGGRDRGSFEVKFSPFVATGRTEEELAAETKATRERVGFYGSTPAYRPILDLHGWGDLQTQLNAMSKEGKWVEMGELIDDEVLAAFAVVAPLDDLPAALAERVSGISDRTTLGLRDDVGADELSAALKTVRAA